MVIPLMIDYSHNLKYKKLLSLYNELNQYNQQQNKMSTFSAPQSTVTWKLKFEMAAEGNFQAIQQLKEHIFKDLEDCHPILKESFYDILQQGYKFHQLRKLQSMNQKAYDMFIDLPLTFLLSGSAEIRCINIEGDNETIGTFQGQGIVEISRSKLIQKFGETNLNILTGFEIVATQENSALVQVMGKNKLSALNSTQKSQKQLLQIKREAAILNQYLILQPKQAVRVKINATNKTNINDKLYLISGKACFYLDDEQQLSQRVILACYTEAYINPKQFPIEKEQVSTNKIEKEEKTNKRRPIITQIQGSQSAIGRSSKLTRTPMRESAETPENEQIQQNSKIKLLIFEESEIIYFQQEFLKDEYIKSIEAKRQQHLNSIISKYKKLSPQQITRAQEKLINKFKLHRKIVNEKIYKIALQNCKEDGQSELRGSEKKYTTGRFSMDKKTTTRSELRSTASSVKCNIRIRKSKKVT